MCVTPAEQSLGFPDGLQSQSFQGLAFRAHIP